MNPTVSDLLHKAQSVVEEASRKKLDPYLDVIAELRRKRWTYAKITKWLNEQGIPVALATVHRFHVSHRKGLKTAEATPANSIEPDLSEKSARLGKPRWNQI